MTPPPSLPPDEPTQARGGVGVGEAAGRGTDAMGLVAELGRLKASLRRARDERHLELEREFSAALARALAQRGIELATATKEARRALQLGASESLREELSAWFAGLGEPHLACAALESLLAGRTGEQAAQLLVRLAVLRARGGNEAGAVEALREASQEDGDDPLPLELLGALSHWGDGVQSPEQASACYLQAAERRLARKERSAGFEDLLRAFEVAPQVQAAASALGAVLFERGRFEACDEVFRAHAALSPQPAEVHWLRVERALEAGESALALAGVLEGGFASGQPAHLAALAGQGSGLLNRRARQVQAILRQSGLGALAQARLYLAACAPEVAAKARAGLWLEAGRGWLVAEAEPALAAQAFQQALLQDPDSVTASHELSRLTVLGPPGFSDPQGERDGAGVGDAAREGLQVALRCLLDQRHAEALRALGSGEGSSQQLALFEQSLVWLLSELLGERRLAAEAMGRLARHAPSRAAAVLLSLSALEHVAVGNQEAATSAAEEACSLQPALALSAVTLASLLVEVPAGDPAPIERAVGLVLPRAQWCRALALKYALLDPALSMVWAQRWLVLEPGKLDAVRALLETAVLAGHAERLADALGWLLSQPQPLGTLADPIARAIASLANLDPRSSSKLARRALNVLGPKDAALRDGVLHLSELLEEPELKALVLERWLATQDAPALGWLWELAQAHAQSGHWVGCLSALLRARGAGGTALEAAERLASWRELGQAAADPDVRLMELELQVAVVQEAEAGPEQTSQALRAWARGLAQLADDRQGAAALLQQALRLAGEAGVSWFVAELLELTEEQAKEHLEATLLFPGLEPLSAPLLREAAAFALQRGQTQLALEFGGRALEVAPSRTDVLAVVEQAAWELDDYAALEAAYAVAARATLGRYGERSLHYRAARRFEAASVMGLALAHALQAFHAAPSDGAALQLLRQLAQQEGDSGVVTEALEEVARAAPDRPSQLEWLKRAADAAEPTAAGWKARAELLFKMLRISSERELWLDLHHALTELSVLSPAERSSLGASFFAFAESSLAALEGPTGARTALEVSRLAWLHFGEASLSVRSLIAALHANAEVEEYARLQDLIRPLLAHGAGLGVVVDEALTVLREKQAPIGEQAIALVVQVASELGRTEDVAELRSSRSSRLIASTLEESRAPGMAGMALERFERERLGLPESIALLEHWLFLARAAANEASECEALTCLVEQQQGAEKRGRRRELARLLEKLQQSERASEVWAGLYEEAPEDLEAVRALERQAEARGDYSSLVELLRKRAELLPDDAARAKVRARRMVLLLKKLGNAEGALAELDSVLRLEPDNKSVLLEMARALDEAGHSLPAAALYERLLTLPALANERVEYLRLAAGRWLEARDGQSARRVLEQVPELALEPEVARLRLAAERLLGEARPLAAALAAWARVSSEPHKARAALLLEAIGLLARSGALAEATALGEEAARLDAENPDVHVTLEWLAYLSGGAGAINGSTRAVRELEKWNAGLSPELGPLRSFLLAEALDVVKGKGAGLRELEAARHRFGSVAVIELGLAERLAILERYDEALLAFDHALQGDIALVRTKGQLLMRAAQVARGAWRFDRALEYLDSAEREAEVLAMALDLKARVEREQLAHNRSVDSKPPEIVRLGGMATEPSALAVAVAEEGALGGFGARVPSSERTPLTRPSESQAPSAPPSVPASAVSLTGSSASIHAVKGVGTYSLQQPEVEVTVGPRSAKPAPRDPGRTPPSTVKPKASSGARLLEGGAYSLRPEHSEQIEVRVLPPSPTPAAAGSKQIPEVAQAVMPVPALERGPAEQAVSAPPPSPVEGPPRRSSPPLGTGEPSSGRWRSTRASDPEIIAARDDNEAKLLRALLEGSLEAGRELIEQYERAEDRKGDVLRVSCHLSQLFVGDEWVLRKLSEAALADRNFALAGSVKHVLEVATTGGSGEVPSLAASVEQATVVQGLLFKTAGSAATEAMALAWEAAGRLFQRDGEGYGLHQFERVAVGSMTSLGRAFSGVARALGLVRVPLYFRASAESFDARVALVAPPAVLSSGRVEGESRELLFQLGAAVTAALPAYALLFGLPQVEAEKVLGALLLAFGPPGRNPARIAAAGPLAEILWETVPGRSQRQLQELCHHVEDFEYERVMSVARQGQYRAGLFASGDLAVSVRQIAALEGRPLDELGRPGGLAELCQQSPAIADLVRLATAPLYAEIRWRRQEGSMGRIPLS